MAPGFAVHNHGCRQRAAAGLRCLGADAMRSAVVTASALLGAMVAASVAAQAVTPSTRTVEG
ncbi:MAG: hypothetical protein ACK56I_08520, partial [bacterium]